MKKNSLIVVAFLATIFLFACNKGGEPAPVPNPIPEFPDNTVDVYLAGYEPNENGINVAKYWKNGVAVTLTNGASDAKAFYICFSGADVYVCGTEENQNGKTVAKYWKNGNEVILSDGSQNAIAFSIAVVNNTVYVSGNEFTADNKEIARYWINGVVTTLPDGAFATEIAVLGNDIYIGGRSGSYNLEVKPKCWKNGQPYLLNDTSLSHCSCSKAIGNDIYLAGNEYSIYGGRYRAKYWKNGNPVTLDSTITISSYASGIEVSESDIYVSGSKSIYSTSDSLWHTQAGYWKNGIYVFLSENAGTGAISKYNNYLYICGSINKKGVLWVNDQVLFTTINNAVFSDIKIIPK